MIEEIRITRTADTTNADIRAALQPGKDLTVWTDGTIERVYSWHPLQGAKDNLPLCLRKNAIISPDDTGVWIQANPWNDWE